MAVQEEHVLLSDWIHFNEFTPVPLSNTRPNAKGACNFSMVVNRISCMIFDRKEIKIDRLVVSRVYYNNIGCLTLLIDSLIEIFGFEGSKFEN